MAISREEKAQHSTRATRHQHQDAAKEAATTAALLGQRDALLIVATLVATVCATLRCEACILASVSLRTHGHRGWF